MLIPIHNLHLFKTGLTAPPDNTSLDGVESRWGGEHDDHDIDALGVQPRFTFGAAAAAGLVYWAERGDGGWSPGWFSYDVSFDLPLHRPRWLNALAASVFSIAYEAVGGGFGAVFAPFTIKKTKIDNPAAQRIVLSAPPGPWPLYTVKTLSLGGPWQTRPVPDCPDLTPDGGHGFDYKLDFLMN